MTGVIAEVMYRQLEGILPEEQKGCRRKSRGTKDQLLLIDNAILKDCKRRHQNLAMALPHSWIGECLETIIIGVAASVRQFLLSGMKNWNTELTSRGQQLRVVNIN